MPNLVENALRVEGPAPWRVFWRCGAPSTFSLGSLTSPPPPVCLRGWRWPLIVGRISRQNRDGMRQLRVPARAAAPRRESPVPTSGVDRWAEGTALWAYGRYGQFGIPCSFTDWNTQLIGCKWDTHAVRVSCSPGDKIGEALFLTPWAPPNRGITRLSQVFPDHHFELYWADLGMMYGGRLEAEAGSSWHEPVDICESAPGIEELLSSLGYDPEEFFEELAAEQEDD